MISLRCTYRIPSLLLSTPRHASLEHMKHMTACTKSSSLEFRALSLPNGGNGIGCPMAVSHDQYFRSHSHLVQLLVDISVRHQFDRSCVASSSSDASCQPRRCSRRVSLVVSAPHYFVTPDAQLIARKYVGKDEHASWTVH